MSYKKIGFYKTIQGSFTKIVIDNIKNKLLNRQNIQLLDDLDFRSACIVNGNAYINDVNLNDLDVYFWHDRVEPNIWQADNHYLHVLSTIESNSKVINSSESTRITNDKFLAHSTLKRKNLPVADFALVNINDENSLKQVFNYFGESVILKPRFGGWGIGVLKIQSLTQLLDVVNYLQSFLKTSYDQIFLEKFYDNDPDEWISVVLVGDKVLFGYKKTIGLNESGWKIFDPQKKDSFGSHSEYVQPSPELKEIALKAKQAIGKDIIGFDFINTAEGYKIVDENGRPGLYKNCLDQANISLEDEIVNLILSKT